MITFLTLLAVLFFTWIVWLLGIDVLPFLFVLDLIFSVLVLQKFWRVIVSGRSVARVHSLMNENLIEHHEEAVRRFLWGGVSAIFAVEFTVRLSGGLWGPLRLQLIHFVLVGLTSVLIASVLWWNGKKNPQLHRTLVYSFTGILTLTLLTGASLFCMHPYFK